MTDTPTTIIGAKVYYFNLDENLIVFKKRVSIDQVHFIGVNTNTKKETSVATRVLGHEHGEYIIKRIKSVLI